MTRGAVAVVVVIMLGLVILAIALMLGRRSAAARVVQTQPAANKWSVIGQALGLGSNLISSWKPGTGQVSVGGKQVTGQTGDWLKQGTPQSQYGLAQNYGLGLGYGSTGYETGYPAPVFGKDSIGGGGASNTQGMSLTELQQSGQWDPNTGEIKL